MRRSSLPRLLLTPGEPAGIGPDIALMLAGRELPAALAAVADPELLQARARQLGLDVALESCDSPAKLGQHRAGYLPVIGVPLATSSTPGTPDPRNAGYVLDCLRVATRACQSGDADALVTGPVQKSVINDAGIAFSGHTEFLAELLGIATPVMMLCSPSLRVALVTTHVPLREVPSAITRERVQQVLRILDRDLRARFGISSPKILVAGLNPHAGEGGHLGCEESQVIAPALDELRREGMHLTGPLPADTLFVPQQLDGVDAVLAMYHDQGLPVLKAQGFGNIVNVTLGLPIVRTSVDHGTALALAGTGRADAASLEAAAAMAIDLASHA